MDNINWSKIKNEKNKHGFSFQRNMLEKFKEKGIILAKQEKISEQNSAFRLHFLLIFQFEHFHEARSKLF